MDKYTQALERVAKAAKVIFDVSTVAGIRTKQITCPHGNIPSYPTHAWWCDKCFFELKEALEGLEVMQSYQEECPVCHGLKTIPPQYGEFLYRDCPRCAVPK